MDRNIRKISSYLSRIMPDEYDVSRQLVGAANYFIDSYFSKLNEYTSKLVKNNKCTPNNLDSAIKELWLGCEIHKAISLNRSYPVFSRSLNAWAFIKLFRQYSGPSATYDIIPFLDEYEWKDLLKSNNKYCTQYEQMNVSYDELATMPVYGTFFIRDITTQAKLVINIDLCYRSMECEFTVLTNSHGQHDAEKFLNDLQISMISNDIYFKKCLSFNKDYLDFNTIIDTNWDEIILESETKKYIIDNSIGILDRMEQLSSIGMCPNQNIILISPPGMAKTMMFRAISNELDCKATRIWCTGKSISNPEHVTSLFQAARSLAPCIVFIEDMDLFGGERTLAYRDSSVLNEFLTQLDGTQRNSGIVIMASTNDVSAMDEALINRPGRFNIKIEIPYPDTDDRKKMLSKFLKMYNAYPDATLTKDSFNNVVELMSGFTGDYVKEVAKQTIIRATNEGRNRDGRVLFTSDDLNIAGEHVIKNFQIGQKVRHHHDIPIDGFGQLGIGQ